MYYWIPNYKKKQQQQQHRMSPVQFCTSVFLYKLYLCVLREHSYHYIHSAHSEEKRFGLKVLLSNFTPTHPHTQMQILQQPLAVMRTWQIQDACALSRHCEPCKQSSWSRARNSQENRPFLTASGVGI